MTDTRLSVSRCWLCRGLTGAVPLKPLERRPRRYRRLHRRPQIRHLEEVSNAFSERRRRSDLISAVVYLGDGSTTSAYLFPDR